MTDLSPPAVPEFFFCKEHWKTQKHLLHSYTKEEEGQVYTTTYVPFQSFPPTLLESINLFDDFQWYNTMPISQVLDNLPYPVYYR